MIKIVNNTKDICDTFNTFFANVANDIGKDVIEIYQVHFTFFVQVEPLHCNEKYFIYKVR